MKIRKYLEDLFGKGKSESPFPVREPVLPVIEDFTTGMSYFTELRTLLYGENISDSNKLSAVPTDKLVLIEGVHPVLDRLRDLGYRDIGWVNLDGKGDGNVKKVFDEGYYPSLINRYQGVEVSPAGFTGLPLIKYDVDSNPDCRNRSHDLYSVVLKQSDESFIKARERLDKEETEGWPTWNCWNIQHRQVGSIIAVDADIEPTYESLTEWMKNYSYGGYLNSLGLNGDYRVGRIGKLSEIPERLFGEFSKVDEREDSPYISVNHYPNTNIDLSLGIG